MKAFYSKTVAHSSAKPALDQNQDELPLSLEIKSIIRRKVSSYLNCQINVPSHHSKQIVLPKKAKPFPKEFADYTLLAEFAQDEKGLFHLYKQKIDRGMDECEYFFLKVLSLAIDYECRISKKQLDTESSVGIDAFLFVSWSFLESGSDKVAFYFATMGVLFCEYYKKLHPIGEFLLILAKISRKHFRYRESILILKKALEYNWWKDKSRSDELNNQFIDWLSVNSPDEVELYKQKFEVVRVFTVENNKSLMKSLRQTHKDMELHVFKDMFSQFLESVKIKMETIYYDVSNKKGAEEEDQRACDLEIQIYNEMSFNFLQLNKKEQSKLFAQKYQSGYVEPQDSKIITLSKELIYSIQKRVSGWHRMNRKAFELLFFVDIFDILSKNKHKKRTFNQEGILEEFKADFESYSQNLLRKDMFNYEIPLPLQLKKTIAITKKKVDTRKFIIKQRSISHMGKGNVQILKKYSSDKVEQNLLFNFRGVGISRLKLLDIFRRFVQSVKQKERQGSFKLVSWTEYSD